MRLFLHSHDSKILLDFMTIHNCFGIERQKTNNRGKMWDYSIQLAKILMRFFISPKRFCY